MGSISLKELIDMGKARWLTEQPDERSRALLLAGAMLPKEKNWINEWF